METVAQRTKKIIADTLGIDQRLLTYDTHLQHDLGADSLDVLEVITMLEDEFGVTVANERIERMKRVGDLIKYFEETKFVPLHAQTVQAA
jgi:acyl carrier protein